MLVVFTTVANYEEVENLATKLVKSKLAACVQVLPQMNSFYFWEGKVQNDTEHLLLIKTVEAKFAPLQEFIHQNHSYDVPEIVALDSKEVSDSYLKWVTECLE